MINVATIMRTFVLVVKRTREIRQIKKALIFGLVKIKYITTSWRGLNAF